MSDCLWIILLNRDTLLKDKQNIITMLHHVIQSHFSYSRWNDVEAKKATTRQSQRLRDCKQCFPRHFSFCINMEHTVLKYQCTVANPFTFAPRLQSGPYCMKSDSHRTAEEKSSELHSELVEWASLKLRNSNYTQVLAKRKYRKSKKVWRRRLTVTQRSRKSVISFKSLLKTSFPLIWLELDFF